MPFAGLDSSVTLYPLRIALHLGLGQSLPSATWQSTSVPWASRCSDAPVGSLRGCAHVCFCRLGLGESEWGRSLAASQGCAGEALFLGPPLEWAEEGLAR